MNMLVFWAAAAGVFIVIELVTYGITSIWFALGSLCALLAAALDAPLWLQIVWFVFISVLTLLLTRPLARKYINGRAQPTNADRAIGMEGVVTEPIDNVNGGGAVRVDGKVWSALSASGAFIPAGAAVTVRAIRGVKLIVEPVSEAGPAPAPEAAPPGAEASAATSVSEAAAAAASALAEEPRTPETPPEEPAGTD